jgi:hypothetical protein
MQSNLITKPSSLSISGNEQGGCVIELKTEIENKRDKKERGKF